MLWWLLVAAILGGGLLLGAPYVPTHNSAVKKAIRLLGLRKGQVLIELGAGDGRIALAAAKKGIKVEAFEVNPFLYLIMRARTWQYRQLVKARMVDFKSARWDGQATAIYVFADKFVMNYLARRLQRWPGPIRVVSYGFELPGHEATKQQSGLWRYDLKPNKNQ